MLVNSGDVARFTGSASESFFRFSPETLEVPKIKGDFARQLVKMREAHVVEKMIFP